MSLPQLPEMQHIMVRGIATGILTEAKVKAYGQACREDLIALVQAVHKAKGRYHSQIAMCNLYDACGLPNTRPTK